MYAVETWIYDRSLKRFVCPAPDLLHRFFPEVLSDRLALGSFDGNHRKTMAEVYADRIRDLSPSNWGRTARVYSSQMPLPLNFRGDPRVPGVLVPSNSPQGTGRGDNAGFLGRDISIVSEINRGPLLPVPFDFFGGSRRFVRGVIYFRFDEGLGLTANRALEKIVVHNRDDAQFRIRTRPSSRASLYSMKASEAAEGDCLSSPTVDQEYEREACPTLDAY